MTEREKLLDIINNDGYCPEGATCNNCVLSGNFCISNANCLRIATRKLADLDKKEAPVSKFNVGDLVFSIRTGWTTVIDRETDDDDDYTVSTNGGTNYTAKGIEYVGDAAPALFTKEEALVKFPEFPPPKQKTTVTKTIFVNVYPTRVGAHSSRASADSVAEGGNRIACVETTISYEVEE